MDLQLWRNATLQITTKKTNLLIDPMLGKKGSLGVFPWTKDNRENPLVDLPFTQNELKEKLEQIDAVFVSHLHPDHWDETAVKLINKSKPIICPASISETIAKYGFQNVKPIQQRLQFNDLDLNLTDGQHGIGDIGEKMGSVNGLVIEHNHQKVYVTGDTIWCSDVKEVIDNYNPQHIIVAGGAATFSIGEPVTMTAEQIKQIATYTPNAKIWITHLEAISPCIEDRTYLKAFIHKDKIVEQCETLADGEEVKLVFN